MKKDYEISVIIPVYNAEKTLKGTIDCVIIQTIGFEDSIQLILINDGSSDDSGNICEQYAERYPDNIVYIEKENGGVSSARNVGLDLVEGKYTVFLDADDSWDRTAFYRIVKFFEKHAMSFNVCSCKLEFSGDFSGRRHPLDNKFDKGDRVVDLLIDTDMINSTIGNSVFRSEAIKQSRFNTAISVGEDSEFVNSILLKKPILGILASAVFYYRRDFQGGSGSSSGPNKKSWYLDVPKEYYLNLCNKAREQYGEIIPYIQKVILYDIRWRHYHRKMMSVLSEEEKHQYIKTLHEVLLGFDNSIIWRAAGMNQYKKLYLFNLKYGKEIIKEAELQGNRYYYNNSVIFSLKAGTVLRIKVFSITNNMLEIEGVVKLSAIQRPYKLFLKDNLGNIYELSCVRYEKEDFHGFIGETITEAASFRITVPIKYGCRLKFYAEIEGRDINLKPSYEGYIGLFRSQKNNYCIKNGYIIKQRGATISFYKDCWRVRLASDARLTNEMIRKAGLSWERKHLKELKLTHVVEDSKLQNRVAFVSVRSNGELTGNMNKVFSKLDLPKVKYAKRNMYKNYESRLTAAKLIYTSKIVVTDDYMFLFRNYSKKEGQKYIQLWHATGAGKQFGQDATGMFPGIDRQYHHEYDIVTVSGEAIRDVYANAFGIPTENVLATGVARTDDFYDKQYSTEICERVLETYPQLRGKEIILYSPTFRDLPGIPRSVFRPELDFQRLSKILREDQIFIICPHPVMVARILNEEYDNILEIRDYSTNDMMFVSDVLITDYSSTMFEYSLFRKPMAFFCYDYDNYERDFYIDFDHELPGPILKTQEELFTYLQNRDYPIADEYDLFYEKYMSACDGKSTARIVKLIEDVFNEK